MVVLDGRYFCVKCGLGVLLVATALVALEFSPRRRRSSKPLPQAAPAVAGQASPCIVEAVFAAPAIAAQVARWLSPLQDFEALAAASRGLSAACASEEPWRLAFDTWPLRDPEVHSLTYSGSAHSGRGLFFHVRGALAANARFYQHFTEGRCRGPALLGTVAPDADVVHPGARRMQGNEALRTWGSLLGRPGPRMPVSAVGQRWRIGDGLAVVVCGEAFAARAGFRASTVEATNVYELRPDGWRLVHHHGSHGF